MVHKIFPQSLGIETNDSLCATHTPYLPNQTPFSKDKIVKAHTRTKPNNTLKTQ